MIGVALNRLPTGSVGSYTGSPYYSPYFARKEATFVLPTLPKSWREKLSFWPFNIQSTPDIETGSTSVFDEIEGESDGFGWRDS